MSDVFKNTRVLIVDDNETDLFLIEKFLIKAGFKKYLIQKSKDGFEAVHKIENADAINTPYDLLICDWHMPGIEGPELIKKIRRKTQFEKLAILMLTGENRAETVSKTNLSGLNAYLLKPIQYESFLKKLISMFIKG